MSDPTDNTILHQTDVEAALADDIRRAITEHDTFLSSTFARRTAEVGLAERWAQTAFDPPPAVDLPVIGLSVSAAAYNFTITPAPTQARPLRLIPGDQTTNVDLAGDTHFRFEGAPLLKQNGTALTFVNGDVVPGGAAVGVYWTVTVAFDTAAPEVEFLNRSNLANSIFGRVKINGRWLSDTATVHANTSGQWLFTKLTFPDSRMRRIEVTFERTTAFFGVGVTAGHGVYRPLEKVKRRIAFIGDSFTGGAGSAPGGAMSADTWALRFAQMMGADAVIAAGLGGTRWVPTSGATGDLALTHFAGRLPAILAMNPDVVVFFGSRNDDPLLPAPIQAAVSSALALCASVPEVYVSGTATPGGGQWPINDAVKAATLAAGRPFIDLARLSSGTGKLGTPMNDGTADFYIGTDGIHPTHAYHKVIASAYYQGVVGSFTTAP